jgi:hypothetical protein
MTSRPIFFLRPISHKVTPIPILLTEEEIFLVDFGFDGRPCRACVFMKRRFIPKQRERERGKNIYLRFRGYILYNSVW